VPIRPEHTARARARRRWPLLGRCEYPGCHARARDRHHRDGDVWNNSRANVRFLCRSHHRVEEERTRCARRQRAGQLTLLELVEQLELAA
jgi:hypothetical protein